MKNIFAMFKQKSVIQIVGIAALSALIWCAGPLLAFAGHIPLAPELNRLAAILAVVSLWAVYMLFNQARSGRKDKQMIAEIASPQADQLAEARDAEAADLQRKFEDALLTLKQTRAKARRGKQYLYEFPWYVIIGAPGSGKTTALLNSGLKFPLTDRQGRSTVQGVAGTRNCDWFLSEAAIFLDTAGRYTTQDSHQPVDAAAWTGFLDLIKKYRPRQPVNGVLVTMSISDLLQSDSEQRRHHARELRRRIQELYKVLNLRFPIYLLFTKCDLVAGFNDFFSDLDLEERAQVWGQTFPESGQRPAQELISAFSTGYDNLVRRLDQRTIRRIQEEHDLQQRGRILDFPRQMALLKPAILGFLDDIFSSSRFETAPLLRGIYFTSGTQVGTPIDQILGRLADAYGFDRQNQAVLSGRPKTYFITRLLKDVIIPEAKLAGVDPRVERRRRFWQWAISGCLLSLIVTMTALWSISYRHNQQLIRKVQEQIEHYPDMPGKPDAGAIGIRPVLDRLNLLLKAHDIYSEPSWLMTLGLYQGDKLQSEIDRVYSQMLLHDFLPLIKLHLEQRLQKALRSTDSQRLYDLLKIYLMLAMPAKMNPKLAARHLQREWALSFFKDPQIRTELMTHTSRLLQQPLAPGPVDKPLVAAARTKLNAIPLAMQIYAQLKSEALPDHTQDFHISDALGRYGDIVFATQDGRPISDLTVPGLFTYQGYSTYFKQHGMRFVKRTLEQNWVLENPAADQVRDADRLYDDLQKLYFAQYESQWRDLLNNLGLIKAQSIYQTVQILDLLSGPDTPLRPLLEAVKLNTTLSVERTDATPEGRSGATESPGQPLAQYGRKPEAGAVPAPLIVMEEHFKDLNALLDDDTKSPPPFDNILRCLADLRDLMMQIGSAANNEEQALKMAGQRMSGGGMNDAIQRARRQFDRLPSPLKGWLQQQTTFGWKLTLNTAKAELNAIWKAQVLAAYKAGLDQRYPLFGSSRYDMTMADFSKFFGPNGIIDSFFQNHLMPFVDTSRPRWRQVSMDNQGIPLSADVLKQFQYAAKIRNAFFGSGAAAPSVQFELKPIVLDENIDTFRLNMEGQTVRYRHGPPRATKLTWPGPRTDLGVRLTFQTLDGREIYQAEEGPWAWLKILDRAMVERTGLPDRFKVTFLQNGFQARFELRAGSVDNPFQLLALKQFRCPGSI